jgi:hypothetical protein
MKNKLAQVEREKKKKDDYVKMNEKRIENE